MTDNLAVFTALLDTHNIPVDDDIRIGPTGYLDIPVRGRTFRGTDSKSRAFINLAINAKISTFNSRISSECPTIQEPGTVIGKTAFTVFQCYTNNRHMFATGGKPFPMTLRTFLFDKNEEITFCNLERLLLGEIITLHAYSYYGDMKKDQRIEFSLIMKSIKRLAVVI